VFWVQWRPAPVVLCFCFVSLRLVYPDLLAIFKFLLRKPMVEFALLQMLLMCVPHFRTDVIVQPIYFAEVTSSSECPWRVLLNFVGLSLLKESHQIRYRCNREREYPKTQS
jgi:hypothetical protein